MTLRRWALAVALLVVVPLGVTAVVVLTLRGQPVPVEVPAFPPGPPPVVTYEVSGGTGEAELAATDETDLPRALGRHRLPWSATVMTQGQPWVTAASVGGRRELTCRYYVGGQLIGMRTARGSVTCGGD